MKYCPDCQTRYDEEILRFCTKDGTPLIDENQPNFTELPSVSADEYGEETVIRRKDPAPNPPSADSESDEYQTQIERNDSSQRIVIPMTAAEQEKQQVRPRTTPSPRIPPQRESNTAIVVLLTVIGTVVVMSAAIGVFWILSNQGVQEANQNINTNFNAIDSNFNDNLNADDSLFDNLNSDFNMNVNTNINENTNTNINANTKTPTPTPTQTPTPTPTPDDQDETNVNADISTPTPRPTLTPRPTASPTAEPPPLGTPSNTPVNVGPLNDRAVNLQTPSYPPIARETRASGRVQVQVTIDENGNVNSARAVSGNPLLRSSAENAARSSTFNPVRVGGRTVKATGFVVYNFVAQN
jgi:TonB family protein